MKPFLQMELIHSQKLAEENIAVIIPPLMFVLYMVSQIEQSINKREIETENDKGNENVKLDHAPRLLETLRSYRRL